MVIKKIDIIANQTDGSNMAGKVMIPNPTIVTVEMVNSFTISPIRLLLC